MAVILESKNLCKSFQLGHADSVPILRNVNLQINQGEMVSVMGPSGSGKSTLLYNMSGMDRLSSGEVIFDGEEISSLQEKELAHVRLHRMGFVFQHIHLLKNLNILDNVILPGYSAGRTARPAIRAKALALLEKTGIVDLQDNDISQASGGQLQRVGICRALINQPEIVFGDEPTGALNSKAAGEIMDLFGDINREGTTVMIVTHDIKVAARTERVLFMLDGNIVAQKILGKYQTTANDLKAREEALSKWLFEFGF